MENYNERLNQCVNKIGKHLSDTLFKIQILFPGIIKLDYKCFILVQKLIIKYYMVWLLLAF